MRATLQWLVDRAAQGPSKCVSVLRLLEVFGRQRHAEATATAVTAADPMLAHYRRCRLRVLQFCAGSGNLTVIRERYCLKDGEDCAFGGWRDPSGASSLVRALVWGAALKATGGAVDEAAHVLDEAGLVFDEEAGGAGGEYPSTPPPPSASSWDGILVKPNPRTLLKLAGNIVDRILLPLSGAGVGAAAAPTQQAHRLRALQRGVRTAIEMTFVMEYCRKGRFEAAAEYADGNPALDRLVARLQHAAAVQRARDKFGWDDMPAELVKVGQSTAPAASAAAPAPAKSRHHRYYDAIRAADGAGAVRIVWVDSAVTLAASDAARVLANSGAVGIDLEWRDPSPAALLQVSNAGQTGQQYAFLFDLLPLVRRPRQEQHWSDGGDDEGANQGAGAEEKLDEEEDAYRVALVPVLEGFLRDDRSAVLAYGFKNDYERLRTVLPELPELSGVTRLVDYARPETTARQLAVLAPGLWAQYTGGNGGGPEQQQRTQKATWGKKNERNNNKKTKKKRARKRHWTPGLGAIVREAFGRPLDKEQQCSNWERRPLSAAQMQYAANDAVVLVQLFEEGEARLQNTEGKGGGVGEEKQHHVVSSMPAPPQQPQQQPSLQQQQGRRQQELFAAKVKQIFAKLVAAGLAPNEAAAEALKQARSHAASA